MFKDVISRGWLRLHLVLFLVSILLNYLCDSYFDILLVNDYLELFPEDITIYEEDHSDNLSYLSYILPIRPYIPFPILYIFILLIIVWIKKGFKTS